jgi:ligand-binding SRPBCC domain-containing protein
MPLITIVTRIEAPAELCFDLARSVELHVQSTAGTQERAVEGVTSGLLNLNEQVTWEATHLGVRQRLTSRITAFHRPQYFRDSQVRGPFRRFDHDHFFDADSGDTIMRDIFDYDSPLGWFGRCADWIFLENYMRRFLLKRAEVIKATAEKSCSQET